jgi:acetone carboxylase gamma subunit
MIEETRELVRDLLDGRLDSDTLQALQRGEKDPRRRELVIEVEQERVAFSEPIVVCLQEHLFVVDRGGPAPDVACDCGHVFGPVSRNWKESALVRQRDDPRDGSVFAGPRGADPEWMVLREFYCPGCAAQLDVEMVPPGYPFIDSFTPPLLPAGEGRLE